VLICLVGYVVVGGLVSFLGWALDIVAWTNWLGAGISIQPNACVAVIASGAGLGLLGAGRSRGAQALGVLVSLIGSSTLVQTLFDVNLGIDTLLMFERTWGRTGVVSPGRMGPAGATSWTLIGLSLVFAAQPLGSTLRRFTPVIACATAAISLLGLIGYLYGSSTLYSLPHSTVIAFQTASFIFAVSLALMLSVPEHGPLRLLAANDAGGVLARRALPVVLLVPFLVGFARVLGERAGLYDSAFGSATRTLAEIAVLMLLVGWAGGAAARHEARQIRAERRSQVSQQRVIDTLESITDAFVLLDAEWRFTYVNAEAERLLGSTRERLLGTALADLASEPFGEAAREELHRTVDEGSSAAFEEFNPATERWFAYKLHRTVDGMLAVYFEEVTARKEAENALAQSREKLEADLRDSQILQGLSTELVSQEDPRKFYESILSAALGIMRADFGSMQTFWPERGDSGELELLVHRGFTEEAARSWRWVNVDSKSTSGAALRSGQRVVIPDIRSAAAIAGSADAVMYETLGIVAAQSTPLVSRAGNLLGMITTHWRAPHEPSSRTLGLLDILARQAADWMERRRSVETIAALNARLSADLDAVTRVHELSLARARDFSELLHELVASAVAITNADMGTIQLLEGNRLKIASQQGFDPALAPIFEVFDIDVGEVATNVLRRERVIIEDVADSPLIRNAEAVELILAAGVRAIQSTPLLNRSGELLGVLSTHYRTPQRPSARTLRMLDLLARQAADLIEQRQAERLRDALLEKERAARAEAERSARLKDEFLATLSHELRTPLNAVIGWSQILKKDVSNPERVRAAVEVIERNGRQQARLITDLLDISRIVSGNMRLDLQSVELSAVVEAAIDAVLPAAATKGVTIQKAMEPIAEPIAGDPARLQQIVWNLLTNAVKFTPSGGRVGVVVARVDDHVEIRVADSGEGIEPEFLPYVFERFRQGDASVARRHGGLGLGLAIVKQLTELHGGSVRASSNGRAQGATFTIELPLMSQGEERERHELARATDERDEQPPPAQKLAGVRVLVIDDEPDALTMVRHLLEANQAAVGTASSSAAALTLLARECFDVIVSDIAMPGGDGYALIAELRTRGIATPALALTAFARDEDRARALECGYQAHIAKPIDAEELLAAVARWGGRTSAVEPSPPQAAS
jgi:PAS domain S-box-containing protein